LCLPLAAGASEALATAGALRHRVRRSRSAAKAIRAVLVGTFTPATETPTLHLYSKDCRRAASTARRPTLARIKPASRRRRPAC